MEASERTVSQILTEQIRYVIPPYQRPYSWGKENVEQLLEDVWSAFESADEEYFIGSLITIEKIKDQLYDVVDGQQRLTTLNLIFSRMRDAVSEPAKSELGKRVLPMNVLTGEQEKPRLELRQKDQSFFRRYALSSEPINEELLAKLERNQDAPKLRIVENLMAIDVFLSNHNEVVLKKFANYLLTKVYVVFVTTASWKSAYRLFNVLNARGMPLSNADLIKNQLFGRIGDGTAKSNELEESWLELEEAIGIERMDQFLGHHRTSVIPEKARKTLHEEFESLVSRISNPFEFLAELTDSAKNYGRVQYMQFEDPRVLRALRSLHRVNFEDWIPPLLAYLNSPPEDLSEKEFVDLLERITYQNWIRRLAYTARMTVYFQLINAIRSGESGDSIRSIFRKNSNNEEFEELLDKEVYGRPFAKAVLLRLEEADQDESVTKDFGGKITIEHVLPQSMGDDSWLNSFSEEEHKTNVHRIGNLALLAGIKNYKAQNFPFIRKKEIYSRKNEKVSFDTTKDIIEQSEWTPVQIRERQARLMNAAIRVWSIK